VIVRKLKWAFPPLWILASWTTVIEMAIGGTVSAWEADMAALTEMALPGHFNCDTFTWKSRRLTKLV
jgi:hypothetical protein